jgi:glycosyltransferase involved in cell wall biosynthesis
MSERLICIAGRAIDQDDGMGVYCRNLAPELCRQDRGSRFLILLQSDAHRQLFAGLPHVETRVVPVRSKLVWDQVAVPRHAARAGADVIFNPKFSVPLLSRIPSVFVLHGADFFVNPQNHTWWDNIYLRVMMPLYCRKARQLLAISRTIADDMVHAGLADWSKITVSYAAAGDQFTLARDQAALDGFRARYRLPERFILTVTRVYHMPFRGQPVYAGSNNDRLLAAYRRYRDNGGTLPFVIAGRRVEQYFRSRGFGDADLDGLVFTDFVPNDEIQYAYQLAEFFVNVSLYESFSIRTVEAMRCGCPTLLASTGACPEVAGGAARLVDPLSEPEIATAMLELERSPDERQRLRAAGLTRAGDFSWSETARRTLAVLHAVAPPRPSRPTSSSAEGARSAA